MKTLYTLLFLVIGILFGNTTNAQTTVRLTYQTIHVIDGYDHISRIKVYVDGELYATSAEAKESKKMNFIFNLPQGNHAIKIIQEAKYEGVWEDHLIVNNYSSDFLYEGNFSIIKKKYKLQIVFDIDNGTLVKRGF